MKIFLPVSLCLIVKNEEAFLNVALKSAGAVLGLDDIVVVDTGSTDKTKEIALNNSARVYDFRWCNDFSAARNFAASNAQNDWVFYIDADEELLHADLADIKSFLTNTHALGMITLTDITTNRQSSLARLYNRKSYSFKGRIHEQLRAIDECADIVTGNIKISMQHHGYIPEYNKVSAKLERNELLLLEELKSQPENPYLLYQMGKCYFCNERDLSKACEYFEKAIKAGADVNVNYTYDLIECYGYALINTEQYDKALNLRDEFAAYYINNVQFRFLSAHIYQNNGMFQEAVECYESCIGADVFDSNGITSFLSYYNIGVILECVGMIEDAIAMYATCGDYEPALDRLKDLERNDFYNA
ncbi:MAG: glycosyltransferase family 2 protein [Oscillospiraceae bacterium]|nr:glycosyltransferase family 2 protein [Oscillospiraceae bacterium]